MGTLHRFVAATHTHTHTHLTSLTVLQDFFQVKMPNFMCSNRIIVSKTLFDKCIAAFKSQEIKAQAPMSSHTCLLKKNPVDTRLQIYNL